MEGKKGYLLTAEVDYDAQGAHANLPFGVSDERVVEIHMRFLEQVTKAQLLGHTQFNGLEAFMTALENEELSGAEVLYLALVGYLFPMKARGIIS